MIIFTHQLNDTGLIPCLTIINTVAMNVPVQTFTRFCTPALGSHLGMELLSDLLPL